MQGNGKLAPSPIRLPQDLKDWLKHQAINNRRSFNSEVISRLEESRNPATAAHVLQAFTDKLNGIAAPMRQSLTYDRGREMAEHAQLTRNTGMKVYFCDPYSPWQRGSNENTNGLLRQYFPKGTDLSGYSQEYLDGVADELNGRPRMTLGWSKPIEVYAEHLARLAQQPDSVH